MLCKHAVVARVRRSSATSSALVARSTAHDATAQKSYYVAMNVFKVKPESGKDFEEVWKSRESRLKSMPGFVRFSMLKCDNVPGKYVSQSTWESKEAFEAWTKSGAFAASHGSSGSSSSGSSSSGHGQGGHGHGHGQGGHGQGQSGNKRPSTMEMLEQPPAPEFYSTVTITE
ncbi:hypothetical protein CHLRE_07g312300v5 [Chlamydomonas reinhardtii]|uniref:Uncharacterized protein n=1 Tax=Chlamydomonas reinhardtii TaxID=3055 RepID=A8I5W8_CHLRE|nr:uncharacterized protein CHLRE_07g312300v5 [Chlamydomonas reinhardtii]PNW80311.1 hypothetical protein CHLRE_07g312300v5 [Chlamydomonas reinhardtii]|eukprot:XP_001700774.1 predicted protein [Chlamydomonas reinhardtii]